MASVEERDREFDKIMKSVVDDGPYQKFLFWGLLFGFGIFTSYTALIQIFQASSPDHWCHVPGKPDDMSMDEWKNLTIPWEEPKEGGSMTLSKCKQYVVPDIYSFNISGDLDGTEYNITQEDLTKRNTTECQHGWDFDHTYYDSTITMDQEWVCDRAGLVAVWLSIFSVGFLFGTLILNYLGDKIGRKPTLVMAAVIYIVFSIARLYITYNFAWITVITILASLPFPYLYQVVLLIVYEQCTPVWKERTVGMSFNAWIIGLCTLPLLAWLCRDWKLLGIVTVIPFIPFLFLFRYVYESPRWLASKGHLKRAEKVLVDIARRNKTEPPPDLAQTLQNLNYEKLDVAKESVIELFKHKNLRKRTMLTMCSAVSNTTVYYGLVFGIQNLSGNEFLNFFLISIVEFPATMMAWRFAGLFGRRWTQVGAFFVMTMCFFAAVLIPGTSPAILALMMVCKMMSMISFLVLFLQEVEMFPTSHRASGIGFTTVISAIFAFGVPYISYSASFWTKMPFAVLTLVGLIGTVGTCFLPETMGVSLPQTIEEGEKLVDKQKFWSYFGWRPTFRKPSLLPAEKKEKEMLS